MRADGVHREALHRIRVRCCPDDYVFRHPRPLTHSTGCVDGANLNVIRFALLDWRQVELSGVGGDARRVDVPTCRPRLAEPRLILLDLRHFAVQRGRRSAGDEVEFDAYLDGTVRRPSKCVFV